MSEAKNQQPEFTGDITKHTAMQCQQEWNTETPKSEKKAKKKEWKKMKKVTRKNANLKAALYVEKHKRKIDKKYYDMQLKCQKAEGKIEAYEEIFGSMKGYFQREQYRLPESKTYEDISRGIDSSKVIDVDWHSVEDDERG